ncbi:MAG TPA: YcnI family protein [Mycobacterium sp.]|nr:YcnI family protein [Mycobacterium sp.]
MSPISRAPRRALILVAAGAAALGVGVLAGAGTASAHVRVSSSGAEPGEPAVLTFSVPNESETGSPTTQLNVTLPADTSAMTEGMPGWAVKLDRDVAAGTVRSVTWTAAPGTGIAADQFALFRVSLQLPKTDTVSFAATQTYADGTVVKWDQAPLPNGGEPEHPAPTLSLKAATPSASRSDDTALWLAVAALVVGSAGVVIAFVRRRT